jgi:hypothetical protein
VVPRADCESAAEADFVVVLFLDRSTDKIVNAELFRAMKPAPTINIAHAACATSRRSFSSREAHRGRGLDCSRPAAADVRCGRWITSSSVARRRAATFPTKPVLALFETSAEGRVSDMVNPVPTEPKEAVMAVTEK